VFEHFDWIGAMRASPVMLVLLVCSVVTLGFAIERSLLFMRRRGDADTLLHETLDRVRQGRLEEAAWSCRASAHPAGAVMAEVLAAAPLSSDAREEKLIVALARQRLLFERHLGWLGTMGNTAPLIGLLGTVWGIMRAFHDMAQTGASGPSVVAAGIAEALFTTAAGLVVAVPAVMLYNHFVRATAVRLTVAENHARTVRIALESRDARGDARGEARNDAHGDARGQVPLHVAREIAARRAG
jgi:biopolymer transport protein ExbB